MADNDSRVDAEFMAAAVSHWRRRCCLFVSAYTDRNADILRQDLIEIYCIKYIDRELEIEYASWNICLRKALIDTTLNKFIQ